MSEATPDIAVVVPTFNAASHIEACLGHLRDAGFELADIIVSDDGSTDDTVEICERLGITPVRSAENTNAAAARNRGAAVADAHLILFVDSDVEIHADARTRIIEHFANHPERHAVFGSYDNKPTDMSPVSRIRNLLHHHVHQMNPGPSSSFWSGIGAIRRDVFIDEGGFDPNLDMMEDIDLGMRLFRSDRNIWLDPELQGSHRKRWTLWGMIKTDIFHRAIPWTRLMLTDLGKTVPVGLNVSSAGKASVAAVLVSLVGLALTPVATAFGLLLVAGSLATLLTVNWGFLRLVADLDGRPQAVRAFGVLWLHYLAAGVGYVVARLAPRSRAQAVTGAGLEPPFTSNSS